MKHLAAVLPKIAGYAYSPLFTAILLVAGLGILRSATPPWPVLGFAMIFAAVILFGALSNVRQAARAEADSEVSLSSAAPVHAHCGCSVRATERAIRAEHWLGAGLEVVAQRSATTGQPIRR